jgi:hypothetical protein
MPVASLGVQERAAWQASLDAYEGMAKLSLIADDDLVRLTNALAEEHDETILSSGIEP